MLPTFVQVTVLPVGTWRRSGSNVRESVIATVLDSAHSSDSSSAEPSLEPDSEPDVGSESLSVDQPARATVPGPAAARSTRRRVSRGSFIVTRRSYPNGL